MPAKAVFLDRDGVINELIYHTEAGIIDSPFTVEQFRLLPGAAAAIHQLNGAGYRVLVVSNQPGIAKEHFSPETLRKMTQKMRRLLKKQNARLDKVYYCLHHPEGSAIKYRKTCECRKPEPGMLIQASVECNAVLSDCYMVGDNLNDILAGQRAGCRTIFIGKFKCETCNLMQELNVRPGYIVKDLQSAVKIILG
ncbi:MAG TPA: HAD family hydrolase [Dehalococcoidales bacterium]|nr:HAD family hydrolase [Dehalococcoidales bacterium]